MKSKIIFSCKCNKFKKGLFDKFGADTLLVRG